MKTVDVAAPGPIVRWRQEARAMAPICLGVRRAKSCSGRFAEAIRPGRGLFGRHRERWGRRERPRTDGCRAPESTQAECSPSPGPGREDLRRGAVLLVRFVPRERVHVNAMGMKREF